MRLIDADELIEILQAWKGKADELHAYINSMFVSAFIKQVQAQPTVEERKTGKWIDKDLYKQTMARTLDGYTFCNKCNHHEEYGYRSHYCPNCGADMRGEEND